MNKKRRLFSAYLPPLDPRDVRAVGGDVKLLRRVQLTLRGILRGPLGNPEDDEATFPWRKL